MNYLRAFVFFIIDLVIFLIAYFTGMYKSLFFTSVLTQITTWPLPPTVRSLIIIAIMSIPILLLMFLVNSKWLKLSIKVVGIVHLLLILTIWGVLELII
ncbi:MAG: hypothetical protein QG639_571 [Patescibacteria group bacterium]|nr:hypothetical protein [Patescibacteria group bacterium]